MEKHRVVVTGLGAVTPIGIGLQAFWDALVKGCNGVARITHFDPSAYRSQVAAEVKGFDPEVYIDRKLAKRMDRVTHFGAAASAMALEDAGLEEFDGERAGVIIGSGIGGAQTIEDGNDALRERGPKGMNPFFVSKLLVNTTACMVSIIHGLKGFLSAPSVACSTGTNAIGDAFRVIQRGDADIMVAGSTEACITPVPFGGFCATRSMTRQNENPEQASRPFDKNRDGFVMGEGAGMAILERLEHAVARGARIYAEVVGYGNTADAYHFTAPEPEGNGMRRVMEKAIRDADMQPSDIEYVNAHGTSTPLNDKTESMALLKVFGAHADKLKISSIKSMIGHLMAGSGGAEFVASAMSAFTGVVPPTINYDEPDPDCPLDCVPNVAETIHPRAVVSNSFGFGGGNASLVLKRYGD